MGTLAMLDDGDMVHRFPADHQGPEYVYLPRTGGIYLLTLKQIEAMFEEPVQVKVRKYIYFFKKSWFFKKFYFIH